MHDDQIAIGHDQVAALVADQLPDLAELEIASIDGGGTVNAIFRIGDVVTARFPLRDDDPGQTRARLRAEMASSAEFLLACPVPVPEPQHLGSPDHGYPLPWATQSWLSGSTATPTSCDGSTGLVHDLIDLLGHLRAWDTRGRRFCGGGRGGVLREHDAWVEYSIERSEGLTDTDAMRACWSRLRRLPREDPDVMCHGDLTPFNLLVDAGHLTGLLDTGGFQAADPALDLVAAWHLLGDGPRDQLRQGLGCSDLQWERGMAWAFEQAAGAFWYYLHSNPPMATMGRTTLERVLRTEG